MSSQAPDTRHFVCSNFRTFSDFGRIFLSFFFHFLLFLFFKFRLGVCGHPNTNERRPCPLFCLPDPPRPAPAVLPFSGGECAIILVHFIIRCFRSQFNVSEGWFLSREGHGYIPEMPPSDPCTPQLPLVVSGRTLCVALALLSPIPHHFCTGQSSLTTPVFEVGGLGVSLLLLLSIHLPLHVFLLLFDCGLFSCCTSCCTRLSRSFLISFMDEIRIFSLVISRPMMFSARFCFQFPSVLRRFQ